MANCMLLPLRRTECLAKCGFNGKDTLRFGMTGNLNKGMCQSHGRGVVGGWDLHLRVPALPTLPSFKRYTEHHIVGWHHQDGWGAA